MKRLLLPLLVGLAPQAGAVSMSGGYTAAIEDVRVMDNAWTGENEFRKGLSVSTAGAGEWILRSTATTGMYLESSLAPASTVFFQVGADGRIKTGFGADPQDGYDIAASTTVGEYVYGDVLVAAPLMVATTMASYRVATLGPITSAIQVQAPLVTASSVAASQFVSSAYYADAYNPGYIVPANALMLFDGPCPTGWVEYTGAAGRYLVGVPSGGSISGTVGAAMGDLSNTSHSHSIVAGGDISAGFNYSDTTSGVVRGNIAPYIQLRLCRAPTP